MRTLFIATLAMSVALDSAAAAPQRIPLSDAIREQARGVLFEGLAKVNDPDQFWVAMHAAEGLTLGGYGDEIVPVLTPLLTTVTDAQKRCGVARELVRAGETQHLTVLTEVLTGPDPYGHTHAAESLYKIFEIGNLEAMNRHFAQSDDIKLQLMAAAALARYNQSREAFAFLRKTLAGSDPEGVQIAAWILGRVGDTSDIPMLRKQLALAEAPIVVSYIKNALARLGDPDGVALLRENLEHEDAGVRTHAATWAGDAKAVALQDKLESMIANDPHLDARVRAAQTLVELSR